MKTIVLATGLAFTLCGHANAMTQPEMQTPVGSTVFQTSGELATSPFLQLNDQVARRGRGADDPAGDDHGRHGAGHAQNATDGPLLIEMARRGRGKDDLPGHG